MFALLTIAPDVRRTLGEGLEPSHDRSPRSRRRAVAAVCAGKWFGLNVGQTGNHHPLRCAGPLALLSQGQAMVRPPCATVRLRQTFHNATRWLEVENARIIDRALAMELLMARLLTCLNQPEAVKIWCTVSEKGDPNQFVSGPPRTLSRSTRDPALSRSWPMPSCA